MTPNSTSRHGARLSALALAMCVGLTGCGKDSADGDTKRSIVGDQATSSANALLSYIPADAAYYGANLQPLDPAVMDKLWTELDKGLNKLDTAIGQALDQELASDSPDAFAKAFSAVFRGKLNRAGLAELGLSLDDYSALYSISLMPVLRLQIKDGDTFKNTLARFMTEAGQAPDKKMLGEIEYYQLDLDEANLDEDIDLASLRLVFGIDGNQLVASAFPKAHSEQLLPRVLGVEKPANPMPASEIEQINRVHDILPVGTFVVDTERVVDRILSHSDPVAVAMFGDLRQGLDETCKQEFKQMAMAAPLLVSGYNEYSTERIAQTMVLELRDDLAKGLSAIPAAVAPVSPTDGKIFGMSFGFNLDAARDFARQRIEAIKADPFECALLAELNDTSEMESQLTTPLPPVVSNIKGLRLALDSLEMGPDGEPVGGTGKAMVVMDNPQFVLQMGQAFVPQLAALQLEDNGEPMPIPAEMVPMPGLPPLFAAMSPTGLGVSIGDGSDTILSSFVKAETPDKGPLLSYSYGSEMMQLYRDAMEQSMSESYEDYSDRAGADDDEAETGKAMMMTFMDAYYEFMSIFASGTAEVHLVDEGIRIESVTTFQ